MNKLIEGLLKQEAIPKVKFDFVVKLLMKRGDAEKLCTIAVNAAKDRYTLISNNLKETFLSIEDKSSLLNTALAVLDSSRKSLSNDQVSSFESAIKVLSDQIQRQFGVRAEIEDSIEIISHSRTRSSTDDSLVNNLKNLKIGLSKEIML